ncbi:MAG: hypothetical protein M3O70_15270 [Actinomycetota bacterium]|nr:hypothetical protein [Actinomycetota bacterium]
MRRTGGVQHRNRDPASDGYQEEWYTQQCGAVLVLRPAGGWLRLRPGRVPQRLFLLRPPSDVRTRWMRGVRACRWVTANDFEI